MSYISRYRKYIYSLAGLGVGGTILVLYYKSREKDNVVYSSWTTNYTPSVSWDANWDRRDPKSLVKPSKGDNDDNRFNEDLTKVKSKAIRHLFLIRHGQYNTNGKSDSERVLTELGRKQAEYTAVRLKELDFPFSLIIRSTMKRANETAKIIQCALPNLSVQDCSLLEEGAPIPPEPPVGHWVPEPYDGPRIEAAFRKYFHRAEASQEKDTYELLVCHANVIRYFVCRALQLPPEAWLRFSIHHASITWVTILPSGRVLLRTLSDTGYMPATAVTTNK